jgi:hypothetical protein
MELGGFEPPTSWVRWGSASTVRFLKPEIAGKSETDLFAVLAELAGYAAIYMRIRGDSGTYGQ